MSLGLALALKRRCAALVVLLATAPACSDDTSATTSASTTTGSGQLESSVVHAELVCDGAVTAIDCVESQIGQRRVGANTATFDCYAEGARVVGEISEPRVGEAATWSTGFARIKATCASSPASQFDQELTVMGGASGSVNISRYETNTFIEGTFSDAAGTFTGSFSVYAEQ